MKLKPQTTVFFSLLLVLAGILGSWALGWWQTESDKVPQRLEITSETGEVALTAILILIAVTALSLFVERPWCKYFCPYGALLGLFNLIRVFPIRRREETCINCKKCDTACPMNITVSTKDAVRNHQCITCHECLSGLACPVENTVVVAAGKGGAKV